MYIIHFIGSMTGYPAQSQLCSYCFLIDTGCIMLYIHMHMFIYIYIYAYVYIYIHSTVYVNFWVPICFMFLVIDIWNVLFWVRKAVAHPQLLTWFLDLAFVSGKQHRSSGKLSEWGDPDVGSSRVYVLYIYTLSLYIHIISIYTYYIYIHTYSMYIYIIVCFSSDI